jgi:DNA-directed RNA polymerase specialized sigma24 family protein
MERKNFEGRIFQHILDNYRRFQLYNWTKEQCSDYLSWLYPRLRRAIDLYRDMGSSFDAYISSIVRWTAREYRRRLQEHRVTEYSCWKARAEEVEAHSPEPEYMAMSAWRAPRLSKPRQVLMLLLKSYFFVSDSFIVRAAPALGLEEEELRSLIGELRKRRVKREEDIRLLKEQLHSQYYRCLSFERKLELLPKGTILHERMGERLVRARTRYAAMRERFSKTRFDPSNRQIAELLQIPKGTVDSTLRNLKERWRNRESQGVYPPFQES